MHVHQLPRHILEACKNLKCISLLTMVYTVTKIELCSTSGTIKKRKAANSCLKSGNSFSNHPAP